VKLTIFEVKHLKNKKENKRTLLDRKRGLSQGIEGKEEACLYHGIQQQARKHCKKKNPLIG